MEKVGRCGAAEARGIFETEFAEFWEGCGLAFGIEDVGGPGDLVYVGGGGGFVEAGDVIVHVSDFGEFSGVGHDTGEGVPAVIALTPWGATLGGVFESEFEGEVGGFGWFEKKGNLGWGAYWRREVGERNGGVGFWKDCADYCGYEEADDEDNEAAAAAAAFRTPALLLPAEEAFAHGGASSSVTADSDSGDSRDAGTAANTALSNVDADSLTQGDADAGTPFHGADCLLVLRGFSVPGLDMFFPWVVVAVLIGPTPDGVVDLFLGLSDPVEKTVGRNHIHGL